jgi:hypothetical protein
MTDSPAVPEKSAGPQAEAASPRSFMVWTGKRHVFRVRAAEHYWLVAEVKLLGDVPAIEHEVRLIDPDTGEVVGEPLMTDDQGVLRVEVPQNKAYHLQLADPEPEPVDSLTPEQHVDEDHAILRCQFVHASGEPLADAEIYAKLGESEMVLTTDADGRIESPAHLGTYELTYGEQVFHAHGLPTSDAEDEHAVYHFVVEESDAGKGGEPAGEESGESPASIEERLPREHEHEPEHEEETA